MSSTATEPSDNKESLPVTRLGRGDGVGLRSSISSRVHLTRSSSASNYASAATVAAVAASPQNVIIPTPAQVQTPIEKVISHMMLALPDTKPTNTTRASLLLWKNYTKKKIVARLMKRDDIKSKVRLGSLWTATIGSDGPLTDHSPLPFPLI